MLGSSVSCNTISVGGILGSVSLSSRGFVLLGLLEALDGLGYNPFDPPLGSRELLVLLLGQLSLNSKLFSQSLELFLGQVGIVLSSISNFLPPRSSHGIVQTQP